ncbi:MAG: glycosyltransferase, partial [Rhodobacteraceae bacterium]|nr:glycosyltransferase [Paracoccaceae bacterium]
ARNLGLAAAAGEIVAFIDDDAVPEPRWLARLTAPFADPGIAAAGGFVVGRNGISFQWRASCADSHGRS